MSLSLSIGSSLVTKLILIFSELGILLYFLSSLVPISKSNAWWIRIWDFPRLQLLGLGIFFAIIFLLVSGDLSAKRKAIILLILVTGVSLDLYRILPYSPFWPIESLPALSKGEERTLSLMTVNVLQENKDAERLLELIRWKNPDIVFLLEANERWLKDLEVLEKEYRFMLKMPQENHYGLAFYSRLPLKDAEIRFLIEPTIPSIRARVILPSGPILEIFGLHPRPPRQQAGPTTERDAELIQIAKTVRDRTIPVIVMGDLNDVAWSHTTRLFRRISRLLDPRVGRGTYPTFPVFCPPLLFPLDYFFHSKSLRLVSLERLGSIGSDHFPMFISLSLEPAIKDRQSAPSLEEGDLQEAEQIIQEGETSFQNSFRRESSLSSLSEN